MFTTYSIIPINELLRLFCKSFTFMPIVYVGIIRIFQ